MKNIHLLLCFLFFVAITDSKVYGTEIVIQKNNVSIIVADNESKAVKRALGDLQSDFKKVMGFEPTINESGNGNVELIIVNNETKHNISKHKLKSLDKFESHRIYADAEENKIYLHGADMRGTIYAIYSFCEDFLGVPPLWYYSSWIPKTKNSIAIDRYYDYFAKSPQVKYRAWFPNDTDLLRPWQSLSDYNRVAHLEAMLRLKLNCIELETTVSYPYKMAKNALDVEKFGLILTSHHHTVLNNSLRDWERYWKNMRNKEAPEFKLANEKDLIEFWRYNIETVHKSKIDNLWLIGFRGRDDKPFWETFTDSPTDEKERAEVINRMQNVQLDLIREITKNPEPYVRLTFYDELSDLLAMGYLKPPLGENVIWTYVAARRDHYPNTDLINFDISKKVKMGYYMNFQFTSTGSHLAQGEGPWKMEFNYRYVNSKSPLYFSVVNAGNIREELMTMAANASMMWNMDIYNTDAFMLDFCKTYFGSQHAADAAKLYKKYFYSYWQQKPSDFPGGMERQYIFQDLRYSRVFYHINKDFFNYKPCPLFEIGYERLKGRSFRIDGNNQVQSILDGMQLTAPKFENVAAECTELMNQLPEEYKLFFNDNLRTQSYFMAHLSRSLYHFVYAYQNQQDKDVCLSNLELSRDRLNLAKQYLHQSQHGVFSTWYSTDEKFDINRIIADIDKIISKLKKDKG